MEKDIGRITKGEFQGSVTEIVIGVREFNERIGVDIREYVTGDKYTGPTKKGLRIPAEVFKEFKELINSISEKDLVSGAGSSEANKEKDDSQKKIPSEEMPDY